MRASERIPDALRGEKRKSLAGKMLARPYFLEKRRNGCPYSHSIVPGGLDVISYTTRLHPGTSLMIRLEIFRSSP